MKWIMEALSFEFKAHLVCLWCAGFRLCFTPDINKSFHKRQHWPDDGREIGFWKRIPIRNLWPRWRVATPRAAALDIQYNPAAGQQRHNSVTRHIKSSLEVTETPCVDSTNRIPTLFKRWDPSVYYDRDMGTELEPNPWLSGTRIKFYKLI